MLRDLFITGVLCERVDNFWIEWHGGGRVNWRSLGLPVHEDTMRKVYAWMLATVGDSRDLKSPLDRSPHCRTLLGNWA